MHRNKMHRSRIFLVTLMLLMQGHLFGVASARSVNPTDYVPIGKANIHIPDVTCGDFQKMANADDPGGPYVVLWLHGILSGSKVSMQEKANEPVELDDKLSQKFAAVTLEHIGYQCRKSPQQAVWQAYLRYDPQELDKVGVGNYSNEMIFSGANHIDMTERTCAMLSNNTSAVDVGQTEIWLSGFLTGLKYGALGRRVDMLKVEPEPLTFSALENIRLKLNTACQKKPNLKLWQAFLSTRMP